jgi:hypothetical protein
MRYYSNLTRVRSVPFDEFEIRPTPLPPEAAARWSRFLESDANKQQDDNNNWRWPLTSWRRARGRRQRSIPARCAMPLGRVSAGARLELLLAELALDRRALPLLLGSAFLCAPARAVRRVVPTGAPWRSRSPSAVHLGAWLFFVGPRLLNRLWFPIW